MVRRERHEMAYHGKYSPFAAPFTPDFALAGLSRDLVVWGRKLGFNVSLLLRVAAEAAWDKLFRWGSIDSVDVPAELRRQFEREIGGGRIGRSTNARRRPFSMNVSRVSPSHRESSSKPPTLGQ
jgi:hypothetical protein